MVIFTERQTFSIAEGVTLNYVYTDRFKTDSLSFNFINPLSEDTAGPYSLCTKVLYRGSQSYPDMKSLSARLDWLYASSASTKVSKRGDMQYINFNSNMLSENYVPKNTNLFEQVFEVLFEIMFKPYTENGVFKPEYVESEKLNLIDEIKSLINEKAAYAKSRCIERMCDKEIYSLPLYGEISNIEKITPEALIDYYRRFVEKSVIEIYLIGTFPADRAVEIIKNAFAGIKRHPEKIVPTQVIRKADTVRSFKESYQVAQSKLVMGFRTDSVFSDDDYTSTLLFAEIFGKSQTSKLFMNVREKLSLCYYCSAQLLGQKGIMLVGAGIDADKQKTVEDEIMHQLYEIQNGNISEDEFSNAVKSLTSDYDSICDSQLSLEYWLISRDSNGLDSSYEKEAEIIKKLTVEDVKRAAKKISLDTVFILEGNGNGGDDNDDTEE